MIAHADLVSHGLLSLVATLVVALVARRAARAGRSLLGPSLVAVGVVAVLVATSPPFERIADRSYTGHMAQHLVLVLVASPLLVAGWPRTTHHGGRRLTAARRRVARSVAPAAAALAFAVTLAATHLTPWYDAALETRWVHDAEHVAFLAAACAVWWTATRTHAAAPAGRIAAALGAIAGAGLVGAVLSAAAVPLVPTYERRLGTADALADQRTAAALMWTVGIAMLLPLLVSAVWSWASAEQRRVERREAITDTMTGTTTGTMGVPTR